MISLRRIPVGEYNNVKMLLEVVFVTATTLCSLETFDQPHAVKHSRARTPLNLTTTLTNLKSIQTISVSGDKLPREHVKEYFPIVIFVSVPQAN